MPKNYIQYKVGRDPRELPRHGHIISTYDLGHDKEHKVRETTRGLLDVISDDNIIKHLSDEEHTAFINNTRKDAISRSNRVVAREFEERDSSDNSEPKALFGALLVFCDSAAERCAWYEVVGVDKTTYYTEWRGYDPSRWVPTTLGRYAELSHKFVNDDVDLLDDSSTCPHTWELSNLKAAM